MANKGSIYKNYSPDFKLKVVEAYLSGEYGGKIQVAKAFGLKSQTQVKVWTDSYRNEGIVGLSKDNRGKGTSTMRGRYLRNHTLEDWPLERQLEYLKLENAVLKKVKALRLKK
ncbi:MAG: transposase [Bacilli bacterium]|nr:transposase [Bacilli bacterium]